MRYIPDPRDCDYMTYLESAVRDTVEGAQHLCLDSQRDRRELERDLENNVRDTRDTQFDFTDVLYSGQCECLCLDSGADRERLIKRLIDALY